MPVASQGLPLRNMHMQVKIMAWSDLMQGVDVLMEFVCSIKPDAEFRPFYSEERAGS